MNPDVQTERDRCALICETVAKNWERLAAETRAEGSYTTRAVWPPFKPVTFVMPKWERNASHLESAAAAMRLVKKHIESGAVPPAPTKPRDGEKA